MKIVSCIDDSHECLEGKKAPKPMRIVSCIDASDPYLEVKKAPKPKK